MKQYLLTFVIALIIGFFLNYFFINQYDDYKGIKVSNIGEELFFIQYGVFSSIKSMEENTISLENYIYNTIEDKYHVYVGITKEESIANKIVEYYKKLGYETIIKKYSVTNKKFIDELKKYDDVIKDTTDNTAISSITSQVLTKYEEVVISGG